MDESALERGNIFNSFCMFLIKKSKSKLKNFADFVNI